MAEPTDGRGKTCLGIGRPTNPCIKTKKWPRVSRGRGEDTLGNLCAYCAHVNRDLRMGKSIVFNAD